jgi:hypothetical protein
LIVSGGSNEIFFFDHTSYRSNCLRNAGNPNAFPHANNTINSDANHGSNCNCNCDINTVADYNLYSFADCNGDTGIDANHIRNWHNTNTTKNRPRHALAVIGRKNAAARTNSTN